MKRYEIKFIDESIIYVFTTQSLKVDFQNSLRAAIKGRDMDYYIDFSKVQLMVEMDA